MKVDYYLFNVFIFVQLLFYSKLSSQSEAVYFEILGTSPFVSIQYDFRFTPKVSGLGASLGLGLGPLIDEFSMLLPIKLNHLIGKTPNFLELGLGINPIFELRFRDGIQFSRAIASITIGYRRSPIKNNFTWRISYTPSYLVGKAFLPIFFGAGFGYTF